MPHVSHDADDLAPRLGRASEAQSAADRVLRSELAPGQTLVHDHHGGCAHPVTSVKVAPVPDRDPERPEVARGGDAVGRARRLARLGLRSPLDHDARAPIVRAEGKHVDGGDDVDGGCRGQPLQRPLEEGELPARIGVALLDQRDREGHHALRSEPGLPREQTAEAPQRQARRDEQHQREGDLPHHERSPQTLRLARSEAACPRGERRGRGGPSRAPRR